MSAFDRSSSLLYVGWNQDCSCFATGTTNGFRIYNCEPYRETFRRTFNRGGGIGYVEMLFRCNLLALVGGGSNPRYPPNKVMIWDDHQNKCIGELSFRQRVIAVKLRRDRVVVALLSRVYVYRFSDLALLDQFNTLNNPKGLLALSPSSSSTVLACPSITRGHVRVELYDARKSTLIPAHEAELGALALNESGSRLATCSEKGTLIRIYETHSGAKLRELRRGTERAEIQSLCFSQSNEWVACTSDKGTVHIFSLEESTDPSGVGVGGTGGGQIGVGTGDGGTGGTGTGGGGGTHNLGQAEGGGGKDGGGGQQLKQQQRQQQQTLDLERQSSNVGGGGNKKSGLSFVNKLLPNGFGKYFESEWSYAQVKGIESPSICAFGSEPYTIIIIGRDGSFIRANFREGGEAERLSYNRFLKGEEEELKLAFEGEGGGGGGGGGNEGEGGEGGGD
ncbi:hypothetical protein TrCOL_g11173 [Triparma columacea]|uniref:WD repeat domain phosphoinositide-interacting protein 3 n=1 Tax=Triparma columacea TaxID=722753 RepID=A0A9W7GLA6_9STRA|nr:hypothetical protein TrCOL_g11173 [Triparma columacea]